MKKIFTLILAAAAAISCQSNQDADEIVVACNFPMTGDISFYGQYLKDGITMAMDELAESMDENEIKIRYDYEDNRSTAKDAVSAFSRHKLKGYDVYASTCTAQSMAIDAMVRQTGVPHFIWSFYPLSLQSDDDLYRVWIDMAYEGQCFINYIKEHKPETVAFLYQNLSSTDEQFNIAIGPALEKEGIKILYNDPYSIDKTDFKDVITKISSLNPDMVILYGFQNQLVEIIKGLNTTNYKKDGNILCSFDFLDVQNILDPQLLDGVITNIPEFIIDKDPKVVEWREKFEAKYNRKPLFTDAYAYDFGSIMYQAAKITKENPEITLEEAFMLVEGEGISGPLNFDTTGQITNNIKTCMFKNGEFVVL